MYRGIGAMDKKEYQCEDINTLIKNKINENEGEEEKNDTWFALSAIAGIFTLLIAGVLLANHFLLGEI